MKKNPKAANNIAPDGYCPKCKKHVNEIINEPDSSFVEIRKWHDECYELVSTNADVLNWTSYCGECGTDIEFS